MKILVFRLLSFNCHSLQDFNWIYSYKIFEYAVEQAYFVFLLKVPTVERNCMEDEELFLMKKDPQIKMKLMNHFTVFFVSVNSLSW